MKLVFYMREGIKRSNKLFKLFQLDVVSRPQSNTKQFYNFLLIGRLLQEQLIAGGFPKFLVKEFLPAANFHGHEV